MGLVIADDDTLRRLNREYRGADEVTDVLSFAWDHEGHWEGDEEPAVNEAAAESGADVPWPADAMPTQDYYPLGEVIVSYPQAERQAQARGADTEQEMSLLIVHGILHLAGFDHVEPEEEAEMKAREQEALDRIWKK
jgi:probable rRNA maturation factor